MAPRDMEMALEKALGPFGLSKSAIRTLTATLSQEDEALQPRALSGYGVASLFIDLVYAPLRWWGSIPGVLGVWGICVDGRQVLLTLSTTKSEN
jgi:transposase-like protein